MVMAGPKISQDTWRSLWSASQLGKLLVCGWVKGKRFSIIKVYEGKRHTITFKRDGGTFRLSGMISEPKFSAVSTLKTLNQSISKTVRSPGKRMMTSSSLYDLRGVMLFNKEQIGTLARFINQFGTYYPFSSGTLKPLTDGWGPTPTQKYVSGQW